MAMDLETAQRDVRQRYVGGFPGLLISSVVWFVSASLATWTSWQAAMWALVVGGAFVFFGLETFLRLAGRDPSLDRHNPLNPLALQVAMLLPLLLPLIAAAFAYRADWLYPAFMVALGAHFLPFMFLFGMWQFGALGLVMAGSGIAFGLAGADHPAVAGWFGGAVQLLFGFIGLAAVRAEARK